MSRRSHFLSLLLVVASLFGAPPSSEAASSPIPVASRQLLLVRAQSWTAASGTLARYERSAGGEWKAVGPAVPVNLGRSGMAWGRGLHALPESALRKKEGDGKTPAGAFALTRVFGVAAHLPEDARGFPYLPTQASSYCVEDVRSGHYNQLVDAKDIKRTTWEKWSELKRRDGLFDWGIVVAHNQPEAIRGAGSCVFLHIWRGARIPTSGCTAMARDQIEEVVRWLDAKQAPVLVQLPDPELERLRSAWALP